MSEGCKAYIVSDTLAQCCSAHGLASTGAHDSPVPAGNAAGIYRAKHRADASPVLTAKWRAIVVARVQVRRCVHSVQPKSNFVPRRGDSEEMLQRPTLHLTLPTSILLIGRESTRTAAG